MAEHVGQLHPGTINGFIFGIVTEIIYETVSPKLNKDPLIGEVIVTAGAVFPTSITTLALPVRPPGSVTVNVAVRTPFVE